MTFDDEAKFEEALIKLLRERWGWGDKDLLNYPDETKLIENWKDIIFQHNRQKERLNECPLTDGEMGQILSKINAAKTPYEINKIINDKYIQIKRDNQEDKLNFEKYVSIEIYDRNKIGGGCSTYQIARQPRFNAQADSLYPNRRGDFMLLINGMPVIHVELKKSGVSLDKAWNQLITYTHEGIFTGIYSLVQIFVIMTPDDMLYFANPGSADKFNPAFRFHWADEKNVKITEWQEVAKRFLSIPTAHEMIGYYSVADGKDKTLKILRSYQYFAANFISKKVSEADWNDDEHVRGGYIWHTTGSGKTLTSFKAAQLISQLGDADKVVFLVDRVELGEQALGAYRDFADDSTNVQGTGNTYALQSKLKDNDSAVNLIVTSIQKMDRLCKDISRKEEDIKQINKKRLVFIIDEAHRTIFGDMLHNIKHTFPRAMYFGFTGTPIMEENQKHQSTTEDVFGEMLHKYSIADGIRDKNVLGFDLDMIRTYDDNDLRRCVALDKVHAANDDEARADSNKSKIYYEYLNNPKLHPMAGYIDKTTGDTVSGIEDELKTLVGTSQFERPEHQEAVVTYIINNWDTLSHSGKFHAIFATSSIKEAIEYYRRFKESKSELKVTALFDPNLNSNSKPDDLEEIDSYGNLNTKDYFIFKEDALVEILKDYNERYNKSFTLKNHEQFKTDLLLRLAHKVPYAEIDRKPEQQINIVIVVEQLLTGYDSKWINTLYLDKELTYEKIIQAFSRTNRIFDGEKPYGIIKYFRFVHTMKSNIERAVTLYSEDKPCDIFVIKLEENLTQMNKYFGEIKSLFKSAGIDGYEVLPEEVSAKRKFAKLFNEFSKYLVSAKIQGFFWDKLEYIFNDEDGHNKRIVKVHLNEITYLSLLARYKELSTLSKKGDNKDIPYDIDYHLTEIDAGLIDADYMNEKYKKFEIKRELGEDTTEILSEISCSFATLTQEERKIAKNIMLEAQTGTLTLGDKKLRDYITERMTKEKNDQIHRFAEEFGVDEAGLRELIELNVTEDNIMKHGLFKKLKNTLDYDRAKSFIERKESRKIERYNVKIEVELSLIKYILEGGYDVTPVTNPTDKDLENAAALYQTPSQFAAANTNNKYQK